MRYDLVELPDCICYNEPTYHSGCSSTTKGDYNGRETA